MQGRHRLRGDLAKDQQQQRQRSGGNGDAVIAVEPQANHGGHRGGQHIDEIVAQQHRADQAVGAVQQALDQFGAALPEPGLVADAMTIDRHQSSFAAGEKRGAQQQDEQQCKEHQ